MKVQKHDYRKDKKIIVCNECKHEFLLSAVNIKSADVQIKNQPLTLHYFTCPKCNKIYRVLLQDARYVELKEDFEKTKARIRNNHGSNNEEFARMLDSMVRNKFERLKNYEDKLSKMLPGTFFTVSENNCTIIKYLP